VDSVVKPDEIVGLSFLVLVAGFILGLVLIGAETVAAFVIFGACSRLYFRFSFNWCGNSGCLCWFICAI